ncbi:MAG: TspO/MBR family protein [Candidatus Pelethousia sp.]|nr:TspO/MBR family protein [Candidatus Pelethousia sp.]
MSTTKKAWINGLFLAVTLAINTLGALGRINGLSQKQISDMYLTLLTPSPSTFRIWSIIYLLLLASILVMLIKNKIPYYQKAIRQLSLLFQLSCVLNMAWILAFSFVQIELSVFFILGLAITLALICKRLLQIQEAKRWLLPLSFGLYAGWLLIATLVNIAAALVKLNWNGFGLPDATWAAITMIAAVLLVMEAQLHNRNAVFSLPVAWAYFGIYQFLKAPEGFGGQFGFLQIISLAGMVVLIGAAAIQLYRNHFSLLPALHNN